MISTFIFISTGCFFTAVGEWESFYSLITWASQMAQRWRTCLQCRRHRTPGFAGFRKNRFILVQKLSFCLFSALICGLILKWLTERFFFFFFGHFVPENQISLVWDDKASFSLYTVQSQMQGCVSTQHCPWGVKDSLRFTQLINLDVHDFQ